MVWQHRLAPVVLPIVLARVRFGVGDGLGLLNCLDLLALAQDLGLLEGPAERHAVADVDRVVQLVGLAALEHSDMLSSVPLRWSHRLSFSRRAATSR